MHRLANSYACPTRFHPLAWRALCTPSLLLQQMLAALVKVDQSPKDLYDRYRDRNVDGDKGGPQVDVRPGLR